MRHLKWEQVLQSSSVKIFLLKRIVIILLLSFHFNIKATNNTQELLKYKLFEDSELECVGIEELMHNENELKTDESGYAERSSCKEGLKPSGMLGALILKWKDNETFKTGTGFTEQQRKDIFAEKDSDNSIIGKLVKVKYQASGMKDKPRFPSFAGIIVTGICKYTYIPK